MKKSIVIFANSRPQLLRNCIESVLGAYENEQWKKVLVLQTGYQAVEDTFKEYEKHFDLAVRIKKQQQTILGNINQNRILGTSICFDLLNSDVVLGIEEDASIGYDSLHFIDEMCAHFGTNKKFRGVNLGSLEPNTEENRYSYSLLRYGLHGQAGALTRETWDKISIPKLLMDIDSSGWDSRIESYLKTGFMVTPNASRLLDQGWDGTHQPKDPNSSYFVNLRISWVGSDPFPVNKFKRIDIQHTWRKDAQNFQRFESFVYFAKHNRHLYAFVKIMKRILVSK